MSPILSSRMIIIEMKIVDILFISSLSFKMLLFYFEFFLYKKMYLLLLSFSKTMRSLVMSF